MKVYVFESVDWVEAAQHGVTKDKALASARQGVAAASKLLPTLPKTLNIAVRPYFTGIIPEYGVDARTHDSEFIEIWLDRSIPRGTKKTLEFLQQAAMHECNHAARWNSVPEDY